MFSGKTSELKRTVARMQAIDRRVAIVSSAKDTRYNASATHLRAHDDAAVAAKSVECIPLDRLCSFDITAAAGIDVVAIDEGSLFADLHAGVARLLAAGKTVVATMLSGDYMQQPIRGTTLADLVALASTVTTLKALCADCRDGTPAPFTARLAACQSDETIVVAGAGVYRAVCGKCLNHGRTKTQIYK